MSFCLQSVHRRSSLRLPASECGQHLFFFCLLWISLKSFNRFCWAADYLQFQNAGSLSVGKWVVSVCVCVCVCVWFSPLCQLCGHQCKLIFLSSTGRLKEYAPCGRKHFQENVNEANNWRGALDYKYSGALKHYCHMTCVCASVRRTCLYSDSRPTSTWST